jgi:hypothetical protein
MAAVPIRNASHFGELPWDGIHGDPSPVPPLDKVEK